MSSSTKQDTGKFRTNEKDQFYTKDDVAKECVNLILSFVSSPSSYLWVEPSAGKGSFLNSLPDSFDKIGIDIDPKSPSILEHDYLRWSPPSSKKIIVFGNPPFGRQSSLAKSFIQKSCKFADYIAFILPLSFTKPSMYKAFDMNFHLIYSKELEKDSFLLNDSSYNVPCVFQIWIKKETKRSVEKKVDSVGFYYAKQEEPFDIAFRRVGVYAGRSYKNDGTVYSVQSHYFLKFDPPVDITKAMEEINSYTFPTNTVGPRSLSKSEINTVLNDILVRLKQ